MSDQQQDNPRDEGKPDLDEAAKQGPLEAGAGTTGAETTDEPGAGTYEERQDEEHGTA